MCIKLEQAIDSAKKNVEAAHAQLERYVDSDETITSEEVVFRARQVALEEEALEVLRKLRVERLIRDVVEQRKKKVT